MGQRAAPREREGHLRGQRPPLQRSAGAAFYGPHFQAVFDFANFIQVGQQTLPAYELLKPYVEYVHVKDAQSGTGAVVPAGQGDGHVKDILTDLIGGGWKGFLSLEPHLTDFAGLAALEQDPQKRGSALDGKSAWKLALDSLKEILAGIPQAKEARDMKTYRVGVVGCGGIAQVHGAVLQELHGVELVGCADIKPERAQAFAETYGGRAYSSLEELLEGEQLDAVHLCTPHYLHTPMAKLAASRGLHVFTEKPPVMTWGSGRSSASWNRPPPGWACAFRTGTTRASTC